MSFSQFAFFESARYILNYNLSYDKYFFIILFLGVPQIFVFGHKKFLAEFPQSFGRNFAKIIFKT